MVNFLRYCCINCSVICCIFWIFWQAEAKTILQPVGSKVVLNCNNSQVSSITLISWKLNGLWLFSLTKEGVEKKSNQSNQLNLKMSKSESQLYALIIEDAQKSHEGNYTCETSGKFGYFEESWELIITERNNSIGTMRIAVIAGVPTACVLILLSVLIILTVRKWRAKNRSPNRIKQQKQVEEIYENHLEIQRRKTSPH